MNISERELLKKWLYMDTMNYAIETLVSRARTKIYKPKDYNDYKFEDWVEIQGKIFAYILENWETPSRQGMGSGHDRYSIGYNRTIEGKDVVGKYKDIEVVITWAEVKRFISKVLEKPDVEERQMDLLELLAEAQL